MFERIMNYFGYQKIENKPIPEVKKNTVIEKVIDDINSGRSTIKYKPDTITTSINKNYEVYYSSNVPEKIALRDLTTGGLDWDFFSQKDQKELITIMKHAKDHLGQKYKDKVIENIMGSRI